MIRLVIASLLAAFVSLSAHAQIELNDTLQHQTNEKLSLDKIDDFLGGFSDLVSKWDGFVESEKKKQAERRIKRLIEEILVLELRKKQFEAFLSNSQDIPQDQFKNEIYDYLSNLDQWIREFGYKSRDLSAYISEEFGTKGNEFLIDVTYQYQQRRSQFIYLEQQLNYGTEFGPDVIKKMKENNLKGIERLIKLREALGSFLRTKV